MDRITLLENELVKLAGPLGKFVVKKQMKQLGINTPYVDDKGYEKLINASVTNAVFDPIKQKNAIKELTAKLLAQG